MAQFWTSHLGLLVGCEIVTLVALILFIIALCAGISRGSLERLAMFTVDTSSLTSTTSTSALAIKEWYEVHYLSICSGMWNGHVASAGKNHSTISCTSQSAGYTFSLAQIIGGGDAGQQLLLAYHHRTLDTKAPFVLLVLGIASMGLTVLSFLYGIVALRTKTRRRQLHKKEMPLVVLRIGFFACIASTILLTISSAKVTASAGKMTGRVQIGGGRAIHAWMNSGFYAVTWIGMAFVWVALGLEIAAAFKIAAVLEPRGMQAAEVGSEGGYKLAG
ncbi:uncharacterized protein A1O5_03734 [Cladophialophora psammophila CBS 110553]|uniref:Uncharacterized protein n=1 Tax=Cladophialophora psammophila CBS 110553 TaxID=1182543 RepID=W9WXA4_9EURO|nr:uncharacterized protein A1O5_03734 [Cladophialophora psammophila CBS 110553]EXJ72588.1 hypothetical protein A1O5_03734 [Cladophialophora psammophila CBS 110553]